MKTFSHSQHCLDKLEEGVGKVLLQKMAGGDPSAFQEFYDQYAPAVYSVILRLVKDDKEAEDVFQEVFISIWQKAGRYDPRVGSPFTWAFSLARNRAIDRLRRQKRLQSQVHVRGNEIEQLPDLGQTAETEECLNDLITRVRGIVQRLPQEQRKVIELAFRGGMTQYDIAQELKQPLGTVKSRIRRALSKVRASLKNKWNDPGPSFHPSGVSGYRSVSCGTSYE